MRFTINKNEFLKGLSIASHAITSRSTDPMLTYFKLEMTVRGLEITANNGEIAIWTLVPTKNERGTIIRDSSFGSILIQAHMFTEAIRKLQGEEVSLEVIDERIAKTDDGKTNYQLICRSAEEYPDIDMERDGNVFNVSCQDLIKLVDSTAFAALDKNTRPILTAINLKGEDGHLTATATDSARLARKQVEIDESIRFSANIAAKTLSDVVRLFEGVNEVEIAASDTKIIFSFGNTVVKSRLIAGDYPVSNSIIPTSFPYVLEVPAEELLNAIDRCTVLSDERGAAIKLSMKEDDVEISASSELNGKGSETLIGAKFSGGSLDIAFNSLFVSQAAKALISDDVEIRFVGSGKPFLVASPNDDSVIQLITPMRSH